MKPRLHQPGLPKINSDEPPPNIIMLFCAARAHCGGINCSISSTLSHAAGQIGLQTPHYKLQCRTCWGLVSLASLRGQKMKSYVLMD